MKRGLLRSLTLCCTVLALCAGGTAFGQECDVYRWGIPDFDQVRDGLVPVDGYSSCVPTSGADWLGYIANHGYPDVLDGPRDWQSQANYDFVTFAIQFLASLMHVDDHGTSLEAYRGVMQGWLDSYYPGKFAVVQIGAYDGYGPTPAQLYGLEGLGGLLVMSWGAYHPSYDPSFHYVHDGGHVFPLAGIFDACGDHPYIWARNPFGCCGDPSTNQSDFVTEAYDLAPISGYFTDDEAVMGKYRLMWRRVLASGHLSILDGLAYIIPIYGLSVGPHLGQIRFNPSLGLDHVGLTAPPPPVDYDLPDRVPVLGLAQEPGMPDAMVLGGSSGQPATLWRLNLVDGSSQELGHFADPGVMTFGLHGELYLFTDGTLLRLDVGTTPPTVQNTLRGIAAPPAMAYDDGTDTLLFLMGDRSLVGLAQSDDHGGFSLSDAALPPGVNLSRGDVSMSVSPVDGSLWVATSAQNVITQLIFDATGGLTLGEQVRQQSVVAPRNLQVTSRGTLLFTSNGILRELGKDPDTGEWGLIDAVPFDGMRFRGFFVVDRSRVVPGDFDGGPTDVNLVPPPEGGEPACPVDLNGDGVADHRDFQLYMRDYAQDHKDKTTHADFNGDGATNAQDIHDFRDAMGDPACMDGRGHGR